MLSYFTRNFCTAALDIILSLNAWRSLKFTQILRYVLKFAVATVWAVVLPIGYASSVLNPTGLVKLFSDWAGNWRSQTFYNYAVAIYLIPNILAAIMFFLPFLRRTMERSNWRIITLFMWWAQARICRVDFFWCLFVSLLTLLIFYFSKLIECASVICWHSSAETLCRKRLAWEHILTSKVSSKKCSWISFFTPCS